MAKIGGARAGAGRKRGSISQRHVDMVADKLADRKTPLEYLIDIMTNEEADEKRRDWAAEKAAAFLHPRPAPIQRTIEVDLPDTSTVDGINQALAKLTQAASQGQIAPAEAQSMATLIEMQRKAIETGEMMRRLESLEAAGRERSKR